MRLRLAAVVVATGWALALAGMAQAQTSQQDNSVGQTFAPAMQRMLAGETLKITSMTGDEVKGKLRGFDIDDGRLFLEVGGAEVVLEQDEIHTIVWQEKDSLRNGALIGFGVGAGTTAALFLAACAENGCDASHTAPFVILSAAFYGGIGSAIGALIDYAHRSDRIVYTVDAQPRASFGFAPIISSGKKGAALTIVF